MENFNAKDELDKLRAEGRLIRKKRYFKSRLDRYEDELNALRASGASIAEIQRWLRKRRVNVVWSTVSRWFEKNGQIRQC